MPPCHECNRSSEDGICDRCLARMFEPRTEIPVLHPADTGPRPLPLTVSEAIRQAKEAIEANRPKGTR